MEKVTQGYAHLIPWAKLACNPPANLKISPLAAVPHKSRKFQAILDLSFQLHLNGLQLPSINSATKPHACAKAMQQLGQVLPRLIAAIANAAPDNGPIFFAKWDIKDRFWQLVVSETDAWNFCYVLPSEPDEEPLIVVPTCLQMGWCKSPAFFCSASETACNIAQELLDLPTILPPHPLEHLCLPPPGTLPNITTTSMASLTKLLEVYVNDFIGMIQAPSHAQLQHFTRAVLLGIHKIFPPPAEHHLDEEPIAMKKLLQRDGLWATSKEILGWLFDGITRSISLPPAKVDKLRRELHTAARTRQTQIKHLQQLQGRLMHASLGIPNGKALLSPLVATITKHRHQANTRVRLNAATCQALHDWCDLLATAALQPTPCADLVPTPPAFTSYCDASKHGAGGSGLAITNPSHLCLADSLSTRYTGGCHL